MSCTIAWVSPPAKYGRHDKSVARASLDRSGCMLTTRESMLVAALAHFGAASQRESGPAPYLARVRDAQIEFADGRTKALPGPL